MKQIFKFNMLLLYNLYIYSVFNPPLSKTSNLVAAFWISFVKYAQMVDPKFMHILDSIYAVIHGW